MRPRPLILISPCTETRGVEFRDPSINLSRNYSQAIVTAGGIPWVSPCVLDEDVVHESVRHCDGVMLTGGEDLQPKLYVKRLSPLLQKTVSPSEPDRDLFELMLIEEVFRQHKPLLAICRGQQILNVALGGTLVVDIKQQHPQALNHKRLDRKDQIVHDVELTPGSKLASIADGKKLGVNSSHHQAVAQVAKPLRVTARSPDGVVEGLELQPAFAGVLPYLVAVQFHPERLCARYVEHMNLFHGFVRACTENCQ